MLRDRISTRPQSTINLTTDRSWVLPTLKLVLTRLCKEMQERLRSLSSVMSLPALSTMPIEFQTFSNSSQLPVTQRVALSSKSLVPGSITSHNMVSYPIASSETLSSVLISTPLSDSFVLHQLLQTPTRNLTLKCPLMVSIGLTLTSHSHTSKSQL